MAERRGETMKEAKSKARSTGGKRRARSGGRLRKPVDMESVRREIGDLVGSQAINLVEITIAEADKGHYGAMKYLFEMIGLYPATGGEEAAGEDSLAKTLLKRLGLPEEGTPKPEVTKECQPVAAGDDAVE